MILCLVHGVFSECELLVPHLCIILILICINYSCYQFVWLNSLWIWAYEFVIIPFWSFHTFFFPFFFWVKIKMHLSFAFCNKTKNQQFSYLWYHLKNLRLCYEWHQQKTYFKTLKYEVLTINLFNVNHDFKCGFKDEHEKEQTQSCKGNVFLLEGEDQNVISHVNLFTTRLK